MNKDLKKLQNLYSWSWYYQNNRMHDDYKKVQAQIAEQQNKMKKGK